MRPFITIVSLALVFWFEGIFPLFEGRKRRFHHAWPNLAMGTVNGLATAILFSFLTIQIMVWGDKNSFGLLHRWNFHPWLNGLFAFLLFDLWMYLWHLANHKIPFLWLFHRTHHSDLELDSTSALRFHFGEILFSSLLRLLVIPLIGMSYLELLIYETVLQPVIIFHHSNIALPERIDRVLRAVIVTPNMHRVHHSQLREETDSNYSSIFSFWDRLIRSFRQRVDTRTLVYGLPYLQEKKWQSFAGMLQTPFITITTQQNKGGNP